MPDRNENEFEMYLRAFRPLQPAPLPKNRTYVGRGWFPVAALRLGFVCIIVVIWVVVPAIRKAVRDVHQINSEGSPRMRKPSQPLTMQDADALLAAAPSYGVVLDDVAVPQQPVALGAGEESAVEILNNQKGMR